jgi:hypothetical protein
MSPPLSPGKNVPEDFARFWAAYPYKKSKGQALRTWLKLKPDDDLVVRMVVAIHAQIEERRLKVSAYQWVPEWQHPSTWLNAMGWENEVSTVPPERPKSVQQLREEEAHERIRRRNARLSGANVVSPGNRERSGTPRPLALGGPAADGGGHQGHR